MTTKNPDTHTKEPDEVITMIVAPRKTVLIGRKAVQAGQPVELTAEDAEHLHKCGFVVPVPADGNTNLRPRVKGPQIIGGVKAGSVNR